MSSQSTIADASPGEFAPTSPARWFARAFTVGLLMVGGANAVSYFFRSDGLGNLLGTHPGRHEAIGFPVEIWEQGNAYAGFFVDYGAVLVNFAAAAALGCLLGAIALRLTPFFNDIEARVIAEMEGRERNHFQFSMRGLIGATVVASLIAALWRSSLAARPEVLGAIYLLGPGVLVATALLPRNIPWQQRVAILVPLAAMTIGAALTIGSSLPSPLDFDQVLLGVFVCWTPQSIAGAVLLTAAILIYEGLSQRRRVEDNV